ncbi:MAG: Bug family tripartite tricarboxylate transporter substrate binding protein, partial [Advenella sp.]
STLTGAIEDKQIKPLGVTSLIRMKTLPDVPTLDESGFKGFNATTWFGILVPAATPHEIVSILGQAVRVAMDDKKFQAQIENSGAMVVDGDQRAFAERIKTDTAMWADVIKTANIKLK